MPNQKQGSDEVRSGESPRPGEPHNCGALNGAAIAIRCWRLDLPPIGRPVATEQYGVVVFMGVSGELVTSEFSPVIRT